MDTTTVMQIVGLMCPQMWKRYNPIQETGLILAATILEDHHQENTAGTLDGKEESR